MQFFPLSLRNFQPDQNAIVCGDFNSHYRTLYGHQATLHQSHLRRDAKLADDLVVWLIDLPLVLRNEPGTYTHFPRNGSSRSAIGLTFTRGRPTL